MMMNELVLPKKKKQKTIRYYITDIPLDCACIILEFCTLQYIQCVFQCHPFFRQLMYNTEQWMNRTTVLTSVNRLIANHCKSAGKTDITLILSMNKSMEHSRSIMNCQMLTPYIQYKLEQCYGTHFPKGIPTLRIDHAIPNYSGIVFKWDVAIWIDNIMRLNTSWNVSIGGPLFRIENQYVGSSISISEDLLSVNALRSVTCQLVHNDDSVHLWFNYLKKNRGFIGNEEDAFGLALNLMSMFEWHRIIGEFTSSNFWAYITGAYNNKGGIHRNGDVWSDKHFNPLFHVSGYENTLLDQFKGTVKQN